MALHIVPDAPKPEETPADQVRTRMRSHPKPSSMVDCHRCGGREVIETKIGVMLQNGKTKGGTKCLLCVNCLLQGERVVLR